ncbi:MAG: hypothetical protein Q7S86_04515 [bacterium]|nr:hypothetical protein [bacterium]
MSSTRASGLLKSSNFLKGFPMTRKRFEHIEALVHRFEEKAYAKIEYPSGTDGSVLRNFETRSLIRKARESLCDKDGYPMHSLEVLRKTLNFVARVAKQMGVPLEELAEIIVKSRGSI